MIRIADLPIDWQKDHSHFVKAFECYTNDTPVMSIEFADMLPECYSVQYTDVVSQHFLRSGNGDILFADNAWTNVKSYYLPESDTDYALALASICSRFSYYNALLVHSSFVKFKEKGIIFTGYSGIGKTTQAELWAKHLKAEVVNGDKAFLRELDGSFYAYGLPWKGSSAYCLNEKAVLDAVVVLRQSDKNRITRLNEKAMEYFMPHVFLPHWDKDCLNKALDTFDSLIKNVPVYLLECRPDEDAVMLTHDTIFG